MLLLPINKAMSFATYIASLGARPSLENNSSMGPT